MIDFIIRVELEATRAQKVSTNTKYIWVWKTGVV